MLLISDRIELKLSGFQPVRYAEDENLPDQTILHKPYPIKENLVGQRFGRLVVQRQIGTNQYGQMRYECLCDCGKITYAVAGNLKHGAKTSCGCAPRGKKAKALGGLVKPDKNK